MNAGDVGAVVVRQVIVDVVLVAGANVVDVPAVVVIFVVVVQVYALVSGGTGGGSCGCCKMSGRGVGRGLPEVDTLAEYPGVQVDVLRPGW